ncbi:arabinofuranosyltransferase [Amycolatopsis xylanica]|uniref:Arabinofuranosyltransferase n=1 Tax=Amycolatopsis xylanica TaxID=589385 RepID=A0A1H3AII3_9PSEU|nr:hypothetical protein [Amycolatopsis xylanica]SDX29522.1 arabinofuranosyltransferase [Amycolatopsis xylanica]
MHSSASVEPVVPTEPDEAPDHHWWTAVGTVLVLALFAIFAWRQRWMSDDGLIVLRTVRQLWEGNGPVFNAGERVEANTSPLWTAVLAVVGLLPFRLEWISVVTGLVFSLAGLFLAMDGARKLYRPAGFTLMAPAGALVVLVLPPFHDFATSGLETGLISLWLGGCWWLLVRAGYDRDDLLRVWPAALVVGLGPLVRPDLALFSAAAFGALLVLCWRGWKTTGGWLLAAGALPLVYQVFRMGYYGLVTPNTAVAKEASAAQWDRGWTYFLDLTSPYALWVPVLLATLTLGLLGKVAKPGRRFAVLVAVPVLAAAGLALYVTRVGGDFMHGRMLLPALFCLLLPVMVFPVTRWTISPLIGVLAWAVVAGTSLRVPYFNHPAATAITDERGYWTWATGVEHPVLAEDYVAYPGMPAQLQAFREARGPEVLVRTGSGWRGYPTFRPHTTIAPDSMGALGLLVPLDVWIHDEYGLASVLGAHSSVVNSGRSGHEKRLPSVWDLGDSASGGLDSSGQASAFSPSQIEAARDALRCPELAELLESVRAPLTFDRFMTNLTGSFSRGGIRFDRDPVQARKCGSIPD